MPWATIVAMVVTYPLTVSIEAANHQELIPLDHDQSRAALPWSPNLNEAKIDGGSLLLYALAP